MKKVFLRLFRTGKVIKCGKIYEKKTRMGERSASRVVNFEGAKIIIFDDYSASSYTFIVRAIMTSILLFSIRLN